MKKILTRTFFLIFGSYLSCFCIDLQAQEFKSLPFDYTKSFQIGDLNGLSGTLLFTAHIDGFDRILVLDFDAARVRKVVDGPGNNSFPSWNPGGTQFAFVSDRDGNKEIYVAFWDGTQQQRLTTNSVTDDHPTWSPDGSKIAYTSETGTKSNAPDNDGGGDSNIFALNPQNPTPEKLTSFSRRNNTPEWSPDGKLISYSTNRFWPGWDVCLFRLKEKKENCPLSGATTFCRARFDPSGKYLAYSFGSYDDFDLGILDLASNSSRTIVSLPGREYDAIWSPKGDQLAFAAENGQKDIFNLYVVSSGEDSKHKEPHPILSGPVSMRYLSWSKRRTLELEAQRMREDEKK